MARLANYYNGELWLDNPLLTTLAANPGRKKTVAKKRRKMSALQRLYFGPKKNRPRRRHHSRSNRPRRNFYGAGMLANRPRRRHSRSNRPRRNFYPLLNPRRHYRRNSPSDGAVVQNVGGIPIPALSPMLFAGAGIIVPPLVAGYITTNLLPASMQGTATTWLVKAASVVIPGLLIRKFVSRQGGNYFLIAGGASFILDAIRTFMPGVIPGLGYQPMLGSYFGPQRPINFQPRAATNVPLMQPSMIASTPDRLNPANRF